MTGSIKQRVLRVGKRIAKNIALDWYLPHVYKRAAKQPVDPKKVVFLENKSAYISSDFETMWKYLEDNYDYELSFISLGATRVRYKQYGLNCIAAAKELATASYIFVNDASLVLSCLPLRKETKAAQLWHACGAFKKWGMSTADLIFGGSRNDILRHPFYKNLDIVTISSPEVAWAYAEAMVLEDTPEVVQPLGVSRTDVFFDEDYLVDAQGNIHDIFPNSIGKKVIFYAPTFRGRVAQAEGPDELDIPALKEALGDEYVLLIKHHPFVKNPPAIPEGCDDFACVVSGSTNINTLLSAADIVISDYSSLVFEYSLFERPMIFFAYDLADYKDWRNFYYDYDELTPGPVLQTSAEVQDYIEHIDERFDKQKVVDFRDKFMSACDGHSTERICDALFGDNLENHRLNPSRLQMFQAAHPQGIDFSVIIPAYNAMPELSRNLEALLNQTYDMNRVEIIVVDDRSTDGTWEELQRLDALYPGRFVLSRNEVGSGSPAQPRNTGLDMAKGEYVLFIDADDWIIPTTLERVAVALQKWQSDILLLKFRGENGREVPKSMFVRNQESVDIYRSNVMWSFSPLKVFRRSLIEEHSLRFPSFMPEDISFVLRAYYYADRVSVLSDRSYYNVGFRGEEMHQSFSSWNDLDSSLAAMRDVLGFTQENIEAEDQEPVLLRRIFRRDIYNMVSRLADLPQEESRKHFEEIVSLGKPFYRDSVRNAMPEDIGATLDAAFRGSYDELMEHLKEQAAGDPS